MNSWLELDNCLRAVQLVRALHRNGKAAGSNPATGPIVAFFANKSIKCIKNHTRTKFPPIIYIYYIKYSAL